MLASPIIEGTLPAFYLENGTATIAVPFSRSRAVSDYDVNGYSLKIKNLQGSEYLLTLSHSRFDSSESIAYFDVLESTAKTVFTEGSFYKAQIAYVDRDGITGYYSTVGILKYTTKPEVSILNLKTMKNNGHQYSYTGVYSQKGKDFTEKAYSYRFIVRDGNNSIVEDTGFIVHNHSTDTTQYESQDEFLFSQDLPPNEKYSITYIVRTNNNLEVSSPTYKITTQTAVVSTLISEIKATLNYDNGYVGITMKGEIDPETGLEKLIKGSFMLSRTSEKSNFLDWETIDCFNLTSSKPSLKSWKDFTVEQGIRYKYCVQQYNKQNLFSQRLMSESVYVDFEDSFLYDGERQLKIRFNPKISSFKKNLLESKVDTIGSKYPFIFKNGNVEYREFPISGLISRLMDEQNLFKPDANSKLSCEHRTYETSYISADFPFDITSETHQEKIYESNYMIYQIRVFEMGKGGKMESVFYKWTDYLSKQGIPVKYHNKWEQCKDLFYALAPNNLFILRKEKTQPLFKDSDLIKGTDEISSNIYAEREFKLEVLDWLTNGQPKLFKSPNEGNYLVRLMNTSLTPQDQLGRMLHNFSCTAYEIDKLTYESMVKYGIINISNDNSKYLKIVSIPLQTSDANWANLSGIEFYPNPKRVPQGPYYAQGDLLKLNRIVEWATIEDVAPGTKFTIDGESVVIGANGKYHIPMSVSQISLDLGQQSTGLLTYAYYGEINDSFSQVINTNIDEIISRPFIGAYGNILDHIEDSATQASSIYNVRFNKRPIQECFMTPYFDYYLIPYSYDFYKNYSQNYQNYWTDGEVEGTYVPAPPVYDAYLKYYTQVVKQSLVTEDGFEVARLNEQDEIEIVIKQEYFNPLVIYHFKKDYSEKLGTYLYRKVKFIDTEHQDQGVYSEDSNMIVGTVQDRSYQNRTSENPRLMHKKDLYMYWKNQMVYKKVVEIDEVTQLESLRFDLVEDIDFSKENEYFLKEAIDFYFDPLGFLGEDFKYMSSRDKQIYLGEESYRGFIKEMGLKSIYPYKRFTYTINIDSNETSINLQTKESYSTGPVDDIHMITTPVSIYSELFYQTLEIEYDITSDYNLQTMKKTLNTYKERLSKDYMIKKCIEAGDEQTVSQYIQDITYIYENYNRLYSMYLSALNAYLKAKEEA